MKIVIADDEPLARALLRRLLEDQGLIIVGEAENGPQAIELAQALRPDAVFLDIDMPGGSGITAACTLQGDPVIVVFVTAHESHAVDAFELGAVDYVLKPIRRPRLAKAVDRVRARLLESGSGGARAAAERERGFWVRTRQGRVRIQLSELIWIEAARDHVYLHTADGTYLHRVTMAELEETLRETDLRRVRRSAFVRIDKVTGISRQGKAVLLELGNAVRISVGPSYEVATLAALAAVDAKHRRG